MYFKIAFHQAFCFVMLQNKFLREVVCQRAGDGVQAHFILGLCIPVTSAQLYHVMEAEWFMGNEAAIPT